MSQTIPGGLAEASSANELTEDECYQLLAAEHRRLVLDVLAGQKTAAGLADLAADVATQAGADAADETRIATALHHVHLPKMADLGVLEYDPETRVIDPVKNAPCE